jgi:hypothetical protein
MGGVGVMELLGGVEVSRVPACVVVAVAGSVEVKTGAVACVDVFGLRGGMDVIGFVNGVGMNGLVGGAEMNGVVGSVDET